MEHFKNYNKRILIFEWHSILWMDIQKNIESKGYAFNRVISITNSNIPHLVICDTDTPQKKELEKFKNHCKKTRYR